MKKHQPQLYRSPISLPTSRSGKIEIKTRTLGSDVLIVGHRQAFLRGISPVKVTLTEPLHIHELHDAEHGLWMTDLPEELNQIGEMLETVQPHGDVLVGGLGLGIIATSLTQREGVNSVTVIERDRDIIHLCSRSGQRSYRVICQDIAKFIESSEQRFDYYLLDTWQGTGEGVWWEEVMPLRRLIRGRWGTLPVIHCWAEDIMWGQVKADLTSPHRTHHWLHKQLPTHMTEKQAEWFFKNIGLPAWEKRYGTLLTKEEK